ncbi:hypothetical protein BD413DRAFT_480233 [Trametes elegans]|nr:hypothetical protein BD413DRAFT_480233 [Trametes elegans]
MDILPLEIWLDIFMLACTDGGYTGCSLSLTSKAIRAITRTLRFHSVALVAYPARLGSFVALYAADCKPDLGQKPKVAHLHFTVPTSFRPYRFEASVANSFVIRQPFRQIPPFRRADSLSAPAASSAPSGGAERFRGITTHGDEYKAAARQLFRLLSPT